MVYSSIINHYSSAPFNNECVSGKCKEHKTGKCAIKDISNEYIVFQGDKIEKLKAIYENRSQIKTSDCIIFKKNSNTKKILFIELKNKKDFLKINIEDTKNKFTNSYKEIKGCFEEYDELSWKDHEAIFCLINIKIPNEKYPSGKKLLSNIRRFSIDGSPALIKFNLCGASIKDLFSS